MGFLSCYSLSNGKKIWEFKSGNRIVGTPATANGVVVFGSADKKIYGVNAKTGKLCWEYTDVKGYIETKPLIYEDKVIFGAWDNNLYALDKASGKELWKWNGNLTRMHFSPAAVWPVAANGKIFITDPQRAMTAIDANSGKTIWRTFQSTVRETIGLSADKIRLYSKTMQDSVVCFSTEGNVPKQIWATDVKFGYEHAPSMLVEKDGVVFGSTKSGVVFALEAFSGKLLWKHKVGNSLISTVVPLSATECVFTSTSGEVGILKHSSYKR